MELSEQLNFSLLRSFNKKSAFKQVYLKSPFGFSLICLFFIEVTMPIGTCTAFLGTHLGFREVTRLGKGKSDTLINTFRTSTPISSPMFPKERTSIDMF